MKDVVKIAAAVSKSRSYSDIVHNVIDLIPNYTGFKDSSIVFNDPTNDVML